MAMADRRGSPSPAPGPGPVTAPPRPSEGATFLRKFQDYVPSSTQVAGFLILVISGGILLLLTGLTLMATVTTLVVFTPLLILTSPIWLPVATVLVTAVGAVLTLCGFGLAVVACASWMYRYFTGGHPPGSARVDYARSRIAHTASHVKDYAREYGGYLQARVKDAAPGA